MKASLWVAAVVVLAASGCAGMGGVSSGSSNAAAIPLGTARQAAKSTPIQHVIFIIQENRSFNNLFMGYKGATTQNYGYDTKGNKITLHSASLRTNYDIDHTSYAYFAACDGTGSLPGTNCKMDGFDNEMVEGGGSVPKDAPYAYVPQSSVSQYWDMAQSYVLADNMFPSHLDGSFVSHQYAVAAYASGAVNYPNYIYWGCPGEDAEVRTITQQRTLGPNISACLNNPTIASEADAAGVSWRYYTAAYNGDGGLWNAYQADSQIYNGPDWSKYVINPASQFLKDVGNGQLADITWITPTFENSDHAGLSNGGGPAWVTSLVNAVGKSKYWKSSVIFIMWDEWGGWYDPVKPPFEDYDGLGMRVPLIMISPYSKKNYVTHVQYETGSVLKFIEQTFNLAPLAASDARANNPAKDPAFNFSKKPRKFKPFSGSKPAAFWAEQDRHPPTYSLYDIGGE